MTRSIMRISLGFRHLVLAAAIGLLVVGVIQLRQAPVDTLPEFAPPYVEVQTEALGLSATDVEQLITVPLERDLLNGVANVEVIRSESVTGLSSVTMLFKPGTDLVAARQFVQERLLQAGVLPNVSKPPTIMQPLSSQSRVLMVGLAPRGLSAIDMGVLARWTILPRLMSVPGVANVAIWGEREQQLQVQVKPEQLRERGVTLQQIVSTTGNSQLVSPLSFLEASTPGSGGFIDTPNQRLQVRHELPIGTPAGLARVPVDSGPDGRILRVGGRRMQLGDVANLEVGHQPLIGDAFLNDGAGVLLVIEKYPNANTLEVTREVEAALDSLRPGLSGMAIDSSLFRPATFIEDAIDNIGVTLLVGAALLVLVLLVAFLSWRVAAVAAGAIALSLVAAAFVLSLMGHTLNLLAFTGLLLAMGIVVDDVVTAVSAALRPRAEAEEDAQARSVADVLMEAWTDVRRPLGFATVIALLLVVPVLALAGPTGGFYRPVVIAYALAVAASTVVALTVTPALCLALLRPESAEPPLARRLARRSGAVLAAALRRPRTVLAAGAAAAVAALVFVPLTGQSPVPSFKERDLLINLDAAPGTSHPEMVRVAARMSRELRAVPGVRSVSGHVGRAVMSDQIVGTDSGQLWVSVGRQAEYDAALDRIREISAGYPGLSADVMTYSKERIRAVGALDGRRGLDRRPADDLAALTGADRSIVVRVYGSEENVMRRVADDIRSKLERVDGVVDPRIARTVQEPAIQIKPDLDAARRHGLKPGDIRRAEATLVQGIVVGSLFEQQKVFDVVVLGTPAARQSIDGVRNLLIDTPTGDRVRLGDVAEVEMAATPSVIRREGSSRRLDVAADVRGRSVGTVIEDIERELDGTPFPLEYRAEVLEHAVDHQAVLHRAISFAVAVAIAIVLILQAAFRSWRLAIAFFLALPAALVGGVAAAAIFDQTLSLGAIAGLVTVFVIAVRHGMLGIARYQHLEELPGTWDRLEIAVRGTQERVTPVLVSAFATAAVLVPVLLAGGAPGLEIAHPLAVATLGGLVSATAFALFVVPALYLLAGTASDPATERLRSGDLTHPPFPPAEHEPLTAARRTT